jgi:hypothetical protein
MSSERTNPPAGGTIPKLFRSVLLAGLVFAGKSATAQTLQLHYTFEDAGTTATSAGALNLPLTLLDFSGTAVDLHGAANSGVQNQGHSLDLSAASNSGTAANSSIPGPIAQATNNVALSSLGVISNFTATFWFKQQTVITNTQNRAGRLFIVGSNGVVNNGATTNDIMVYFQSTNALYLKVNNAIVSAPLYFNPLPTNEWLFVGVTYDGTNNARFYYGTEGSPAKLVAIRSIGLQPVDLGSAANLMLGNQSADRARAMDGWMDDFRFYTGDASSDFIESVRQEATPVLITDLFPDGMSLMQGTETLSFNAGSANGIEVNGIEVSVNGSNVTSGLVIGGTANNRTVSFTGLPVNPPLVKNAALNEVTINIRVTDSAGIVSSNTVTYDAFSPDNFTWEAEDYDYAADPLFGPGGSFIDNPRYAFESAPDTYWQREGMPPVDYFDNAPGAQNHVFRGIFDLVATEFSVGLGANGGPSQGELMRQKILDALALDDRIRDVDVGNFDSGDWINFTRTYPTGPFNVYTRAAFGGGTGNSTLDYVTSGNGTPVQTTTNLGSFNIPNTGGWESYRWVPLRDAGGNLVRVDLDGVSTLRLTAGSGGGGNNNFLMLVPANTNLPAISDVYPNGTNMFQPAAALTFTASSPIGAVINPSGIQVALTIQTVVRTITTNLTSENGLVITGTTSSRNVSVPLITNATYTAVITLKDANGSPASTTVRFDTYDPVFVWEAEDYDFNAGQYIDHPAPNAFAGQMGTAEIDYHDNVTVSQNGSPAYRTADPVGLEVNGDAPKRLEYINTGFIDYDVGWFDNGNWNNYTRTLPEGQYNVLLRAANGSTGTGGVTLAKVTAGQGTASQTTTNLGTFAIPATGGWQAYTWVPLRDASGNLAKIQVGGLETIRATSSGNVNANFYALVPANTNLPVINNVYPDGATLVQKTNKLSFTVSSSAGISTNQITVMLNGVTLSNLVFSGSASLWNVSYTGLVPNTAYTAALSVTDLNGNSASTTVKFDTFGADYYTWEAEDYDYDSGKFFDNPQVDAYTNLSAVADVDFHESNTGGTFVYRTSGTATEASADAPRAKFAGAYDFTIGFFGAGEWGNYTRTYPAGTYNVWGRFACGDANQSAALLSRVTGGWGTTSQTTNYLGTFLIPTSGWSSYGWVQLTDALGNPQTITLDGSTNTLKLTRDPTAPYADANVNFLMLVPAAASISLNISVSGTTVHLSFASQSGANYQIEYKNDLTDANWTPLGSAVAGDGNVKGAVDSTASGKRFYRLRVQ